jgi:hypothetical protein
MTGSRLSRIVVRRAGAPGAAAVPKPGRCVEDRRSLRTRAVDVSWRLRGADLTRREPELAART